MVRDSSDDNIVNPKLGTLRHAVIQPEPLWIIFAHDLRIKLSQELIMTINKNIDGRGANVHICDGAQITIQFVKNIIILNIHIQDIRDSIYGATNVWIDHVSMSNCEDGLIDAIQGSTAITISNCHFTNHNEVTSTIIQTYKKKLLYFLKDLLMVMSMYLCML